MPDQRLLHVALVVRDYDEAIEWYSRVLDFELIADEYQPEQDKRWVVIRPRGAGLTSILLARATTPEQAAAIGNQTGGRVFLFLQTDDFERDFARLQAHGVTIVRPPQSMPYGRVAVCADLYGTLWDLIEPSSTV